MIDNNHQWQFDPLTENLSEKVNFLPFCDRCSRFSAALISSEAYWYDVKFYNTTYKITSMLNSFVNNFYVDRWEQTTSVDR